MKYMLVVLIFCMPFALSDCRRKTPNQNEGFNNNLEKLWKGKQKEHPVNSMQKLDTVLEKGKWYFKQKKDVDPLFYFFVRRQKNKKRFEIVYGGEGYGHSHVAVSCVSKIKVCKILNEKKLKIYEFKIINKHTLQVLYSIKDDFARDPNSKHEDRRGKNILPIGAFFIKK